MNAIIIDYMNVTNAKIGRAYFLTEVKRPQLLSNSATADKKQVWTVTFPISRSLSAVCLYRRPVVTQFDKDVGAYKMHQYKSKTPTPSYPLPKSVENPSQLSE